MHLQSRTLSPARVAPALCAVILALTPSARGDTVRAAASRTPAIAFVRAGKGALLHAERSPIRDGVARALLEHSDLVLQSPEEAGITAGELDDCGFDLLCLLEIARARAPRAGRSAGAPPLGFVVLIDSEEQYPTRHHVTLIELADALEVLDQASRRRDDWRDVTALRIEGGAARSTISSEAGGGEDPTAAVATAFAGSFQRALERADRWHPFGVLELKTPVDGLQIAIDGARVGETRGPATRIVDLAPGRRTIALEDPAGEWLRYETTADVLRGQETAVFVDMTSRSSVLSGGPRSITFWSGIGIAAVGAAISVYGAIQAANQPVAVVCLRSSAAPASACGSGEFLRFGAPDAASADTNPNGSGPPIAPLGAGLFLGGAATSAGALILGDDWTIPWIPALVGLATAGLTFGIAAALDGENAVCAQGHC